MLFCCIRQLAERHLTNRWQILNERIAGVSSRLTENTLINDITLWVKMGDTYIMGIK